MTILTCENCDNLVEVCLCRKCLAETARRSGVQTASDWRSIETAPRDGSRMLATGGGLGETVDIVSYNDRVGAWDTGNYTLDDRDDEADGYSRPDRWMPLPASSSVPSADGGCK